MALVVICGHPCSGKSTLARFLEEALKVAGAQTVVILGEDSLNLTKRDAYKDNNAEKNLRGVLRSTIDRMVSRDKVVIADSLNNIKGYRYELWCIARAEGTRYCMVHCDVPQETAHEWNAGREPTAAYPPEIMDDLLRRFERPDGRNRWDSPLFTLYPDRDELSPSSPGILEIVEAMVGEQKTATGRVSKTLKPTIATQNARMSDTNLLYELDRATQEILSALVEAQANGPSGSMTVGEGLPPVHVERLINLPELRRYKRTFIKLASQNMGAAPHDTLTAKRMFVDYINREIASSRT
ncbi:RNA polymerase II elongator associated protein [Klebsormidium nitens]|uniref:Protein KTI12 homolog n=1 Tax=Klebsormidium nitens TaxID=105231 RepID=A0A1Y1I287_KLENI|nr:RNA polymerase II elongator associated protein [Klebsormidium nitens]|eukprot:GAQ82857.1 RNA polymerase II elongator associated protein [Klebsormidium nitens]